MEPIYKAVFDIFPARLDHGSDRRGFILLGWATAAGLTVKAFKGSCARTRGRPFMTELLVPHALADHQSRQLPTPNSNGKKRDTGD